MTVNPTLSEGACQVLVVDDSDDIHALLGARLHQEDVSLVSAMSASEGLGLALALRPQLVLLDVELGDGSGFDVCRALKSDPRTMDIPIIFLTGASDVEAKIRGFELGAVDYVTKPFEPTELRARVRAALRTKRLHDLLASRAMVDGLTSLWNRRYFEERLTAELAASARHGHPLSLVMADIDHFKRINDTYGHPVGDRVIQGVAQVLLSRSRAEDVPCRFGGEEFVVIVPNSPVPLATKLACRLRDVIRAARFPDAAGGVSATMSFGVTELRTDDEPHDFVERADEALYEAKRTGRDRVVTRD